MASSTCLAAKGLHQHYKAAPRFEKLQSQSNTLCPDKRSACRRRAAAESKAFELHPCFSRKNAFFSSREALCTPFLVNSQVKHTNVLHSSLTAPRISDTQLCNRTGLGFRSTNLPIRGVPQASSTTNAEAKPDSNTSSELDTREVVIVGAGIAGLATALALHRVGIKSLVLESAPGPRDGGAAIALWRNAWRALDVLGVKELRHRYILLDRVQLCTKTGKVVREFGLDEVKGGPHEYRGVHRSALLKALAAELPKGTVRYGATVQQVSAGPDKHGAELVLEDGQRIHAKVVVGCDGTKSAVARHLALQEPKYAGYSAIRGVAHFPGGHNQESAVRQIWGAGVRAGTYPMNETDVYWFTVFNSPQGVRAADAHERKQQALDSVAGWGGDILDIIQATPAEGTSRSDIRDRWTLPIGGRQSWGRGNVTVTGDAAHPMTPNLGQGGCVALEDAVVLARELARAAMPSNRAESTSHDVELDPNKVSDVLRKYERLRIPRAAKLTVQSWVYGTLLQIGFPPVTFARDNVVVPYLFKPDHWLDHTLYDCGELPTNLVRG